MDKITNILNNNFKKNNLPINVSIIKNLSGLTLPSDCSPPLSFDETIIYRLINTINNDNIAFIILEKLGGIENCIYIKYRCVFSPYRKYGFGIFLAYIGVMYAMINKYSAIFSMGVGKSVNSNYSRETEYGRNRKWVLSQGLLIKKLGFYDNFKFKNNGNTQRSKQKKNLMYCGDFAETILYINSSNLDKYFKYNDLVLNKPEILFKNYLKVWNISKSKSITKSSSAKLISTSRISKKRKKNK